MKKILCFIDELGPGGAERQLVGLASMLKNHGYDVSVYCYHPIYFYEPILSENEVSLIKENSLPQNVFQKLWRSFRVLKNGGYDFIISFSPGSSLAALICKPFFRKTKLLVSDRNMTPVISLKQKVIFNLYRLADYIVPNSYTQTKILAKHYPFMQPKLRTITNFVDFSKFQPSLPICRSRNGILNMIVVARHAVDKNISNFIKAVYIAKSRGLRFKVDWYGNYNNRIGEQNLGLIKEYAVDDIIRFLPPHNNIKECYAKADVMCLPSVREGFSNVIGEAMCMGLPVICGCISDNVKMIEDGVNGYLFDPTSPDDIAEAIEKMINTDDNLFKTFSNNNLKKAHEMLSATSFLKKYVNIIES
ncbi:glycosyltransferase family 4 protein [Bacteroides sp. AN502(2024)]|uniref:glycosyltransferase family 4 protein n=1 Tax=Bacteroides sp. AN502(2024) TaxID=3160599 RepID=UPI003515BEBB